MQEYRPGPRNLITDVPGIQVGNAEDTSALTGVTVISGEAGFVAAVDVRGGAPGTRDTDALDPTCLVERIHALTLSGGSVFGLDAAGGVTAALAQAGIGFTFGPQPVPCPIVPGAVVFDLNNGGDKAWGYDPPYRRLGITALQAVGQEFALGNAGVGLGCIAGDLKGGLGSASLSLKTCTVGAIVAVNSFGAAIDPRTGDLWSRPFEMDGEFGSTASAAPSRNPAPLSIGTKAPGQPGANTTVAVVATDASLDKSQSRRLAIMAADGMARAIRPVHSPFDGDTVFALSTAQDHSSVIDAHTLNLIGTAAADVLARAIGRAIHAAQSIPGHQSWRDRSAAT